MAIRVDTKRSKFYNELSENEQKEFFNLKVNKFLHKIDTLYYSVYLKNDSNDDEIVSLMLSDIKDLKESLLKSGEESLDFIGNSIEFKKGIMESKKCIEGLEMLRGRHADYAFRLSVRDCYDIYICSHIRNSNTPRILIQIRSMYLWRFGTEKALYDSYNKVSELLEHYNLEVDRTQENRIDFAYHTNSIQSPTKFFSPDNASKIYKGGLKKYNCIGLFNDDGTYTLDYFSLGSPKSNNLFFRIYDKTREVIEMNYKGFFFDVWLNEGLINFYDKYCLEYAYVNKGNYDKIYEASLKFYMEYGKDDVVKFHIDSILSDSKSTFQDIKEVSLRYMPSVTKILNIEFETKRKYYYYYNEAINVLPSNCNIKELERVFKIVDNSKIFLDMLTYKVVRFEKNGDLLSFWKRLRSVKIKSLSEESIKATYCNNIDFEKIKTRVLGAIGSYAVYKENLNDDVSHDIIDFLADLNDNSVYYSGKYIALDGDTGEVLELNNPNIKENYKDKKNKKYKQIKNRLR